MKNLKTLCVALTAFVLICMGACKKDVCETHTATYSGDVAAIINTKCANSDCHDGSNVDIPFSARNFGHIDTLMANTNNGLFNTRVLVDQTMPPTAYGAAALTAEELEILTCWKEAGYPQ